MEDNCIFCKIANGDISSKTLYEDDMFRVILDINPAAKGHALILPKKHFADIYELDQDTAGEAKRMAAVMKEALGCEGMNILQNNGKIAGQTVFHFHIHLIPRYKEDEIGFHMEGKGEPDYSLDDVQKVIVEGLKAVRAV